MCLVKPRISFSYKLNIFITRIINLLNELKEKLYKRKVSTKNKLASSLEEAIKTRRFYKNEKSR